jgi:hypothetical protein
VRELGYAEVTAGDPPDRTGQAWCYKGARYLVVGAPRPFPEVGTYALVIAHPVLCLDTGVETSFAEAWLLGCRREL